LANQYELDEVTIKDGDYVSKRDLSPISGSLVSRHKNGQVFTETYVEGGQSTGQSKTYDQQGRVVSDNSSPLNSKQQGGISYQSVSAQYRQHKQKNLEMLPYFGAGLFGLIILIMISLKAKALFKWK
jgi:hypothetical protein